MKMLLFSDELLIYSNSLSHSKLTVYRSTIKKVIFLCSRGILYTYNEELHIVMSRYRIPG